MKTRRSAEQRPIRLTAIALALSALLASCGGGGSSGDGGIIGTGKTLDGTVHTNRAFASNDVTLKAKTGERSTTSIATNGRFSANSLTDGPYLMRVDLGNDNAYYSVAYLTEDSTVQNIHAYTDVAIRNWFAVEGLDIDAAFNSDSTISELPTASEIGVINEKFRDQIAGALASYDLSSTDLQSVEFNADDTGVDEFLDRNPILISDENGDSADAFVTITIQDRDTDTQSTVVKGLPIKTDLTVSDDVPPSAPAGLRVLPSASNEIVLAWDSATDNIGVTAYEVARDGEVIATTPYPAYIDSPLQAGVEYSYTITALDAFGNRSMASASGSSETLAAPDTIAPPPPTSLQLTSTSTSIDVRWVQSDIGDVANFTVLRSVGGSMLDVKAVVTSTQLTDAGLNSGTNYCYQIVANDASENASDPSDTICTVTGGNSVVSGGSTTTPDVEPPVVIPPATSTGGDNAHLAAVDVSSLACSTELDVSELTGEARISPGCYLVNSTITLRDTNLTVDAGVVLKFASGTEITIDDGSSLSANGTLSSPVVLTGQQTTAGYWDGLDFRNSNNVKNTLEHVVVEYAGEIGTSTAAITSTASSTRSTRLNMANVLIRHSSNYGFNFQDGTLVERFDSITSTQNGQPGQLSTEIAGMFGTGMSMTGNTSDILDLTNTLIGVATTLPDMGVPYNADVLTVDAPLEIAAGVTISFEAGGQLTVRQSGSLRVSGTAADPVLLTANQTTPGYWQGVEFNRSNSTNNELRNLTIEYGGSGSSASGNLITDSASSQPALLNIDTVTLRHSLSNGFYFDTGTLLGQFDNVVSTLNEESGTAQPSQIPDFGVGNDFSGNTFDRVTLTSDTISTPQSWPLLNVAIRHNNLNVTGALTLPAGQEFIANSGDGITVSFDGSLTAIGTAAAPIIFRGEQATAGYWPGINFIRTNSPQNQLDHVQISDAGSGASATSGNIEMDCTNNQPASLSLSNAFISNSAGWGVFVDRDGCTLNLGSNVTFSNNAQGDINN